MNDTKPTATDSVSKLSERKLLASTQLMSFLLLAVMAVPLILGRVYTSDDLGEFHLPLRDFYARQLAAGESFAWLPSLYGGFYVTGEGQTGRLPSPALVALPDAASWDGVRSGSAP